MKHCVHIEAFSTARFFFRLFASLCLPVLAFHRRWVQSQAVQVPDRFRYIKSTLSVAERQRSVSIVDGAKVNRLVQSLN